MGLMLLPFITIYEPHVWNALLKIRHVLYSSNQQMMLLYRYGMMDQSEQNKSATTCDFQQCGILTSVDSDELGQPPFKLRNSK